jgi:hypothetical protein
MRNFIAALTVAMTACLAAAATAAAGDPGPIQVSGQSATTSQQAVAGSSATQVAPSNTNISIRVLSPGNDGAVSQTNTAGSSATAGNQGATTQSANQAAAGNGIQTSQQSAGTDQLAVALSAATQLYPSNVNVPIRVLSPGNDGSVTQSNTDTSRADAGNTSTTGQTGSQTQAGSSCGCDSSATPIQTADQSASTDQSAAALSDATQIDPSNTALSVRVLSPGDGGSVSQDNTAASSATAGNNATTTQNGTQSQAAGRCGCSGDAIQQAKQSAATDQGAAALSAATQHDPSNDASPVRVWSPGSDGSVKQSNSANSSANAGNSAATTQNGTQTDASGNGIQIAGQDAATSQGAPAASAAEQAGASNDASPVRVASPGSAGSVTQSNSAGSSAAAGNTAATTQNANQSDAGASCGCGGLGIQVAGQKADTDQTAVALSKAVQLQGERSPCGCGGSSSGNVASPVRVWSPGSDGSVSQSNSANSSATAGNRAATTQYGTQSEAGGGLQIQALGQQAATDQTAIAASLAAQLDPSNDASPVRVHSPGGGGSVTQSNGAASSAAAGNDAWTNQTGRQTIAPGKCGCGQLPIQVAGQWAGTEQLAKALSAALQAHPSNDSAPLAVWSPSGGGSLAQSNGAGSRSDAGDRAGAAQGVSQTA